MSGKEQPPHGTYPSKSSRSGLFHHELTTSPHAISSAPMETAAASRSSTYPPHNLNRPQDEQIQELLKTLDIYRKENDLLRSQLEESQHQARAERTKSDYLEQLLRDERVALIRSQKGLQQAQSKIGESTRSVQSFPEPTTQTSSSRLAIMPPLASQTLVQRSVNPASSQHPINHLSHTLDQFFQQAESWAKAYAITPVPVALQSVKQKFKERRINLAIDSQLLQESDTARHAMTRLILFAIIDATFQPQCFEHFKPESSEQLQAERRQAYSGIPSEERKALTEARTRTIKMFVQDPKWAEFLNSFVSYKCGEIWQMLRPVFGPGAAEDGAWPSFVGLFRQAVSIALIMHQRVCLFRVDFPPTGEKSCFNPAVMSIMGSTGSEWRTSAGAGPQTLRLAVTPVIYEITWGVNGAMGEPKPICKAGVLLE